MIDYLERLDAELMKAARAQETAARRPAVRLPCARLGALAPVAAVCAAIVAAIVLIPRAATETEQGPARPGPVPATLTGSYSRGPDALIIDPDRYTIDAGDELIGDVALRQGLLIFGSPSAGRCADDRDGRYVARRDGPTLVLVAVQESCAERKNALTQGSWKRDG